MNRTLNLNKSSKAKSTTQTRYDHSQVGTIKESFGTAELQPSHALHQYNDNNSSSSSSSSAQTNTANQSAHWKELDNGYHKKGEGIKPEHAVYSKSYNDDTLGMSSPAIKSSHHHHPSSRSYPQKKANEQLSTPSQHQNKLFTQAFVPQSQYHHRQHSSSSKQQQQSHYHASDTAYPILASNNTVISSPHLHNVSYTPSPPQYQYHHQAAKSISPRSVHPQLSPSLASSSAPIPIPHSWTAPNIPHYYAVPSPVFDASQVQYHRYYTQYQPAPPSHHVYSLPNQSLTPPQHQLHVQHHHQQQQQHHHHHQQQQQSSPSPPLNEHSSTNAIYQQTQLTSPTVTPRGNKAIPIINPDTMTPVHADALSNPVPLPANDSSTHLQREGIHEKKEEKVVLKPIQFVDPAIREQEERERQELEEKLKAANVKANDVEVNDVEVSQNKVDINDGDNGNNAVEKAPLEIMSAATTAPAEAVLEVATNMNEEEESETPTVGNIVAPSANNMEKSVEYSSITDESTITAPAPRVDDTDLAVSKELTVPTTSTVAMVTDSQVVEITPAPVVYTKAPDTGIIQYDPAFLMQFMPLCLDTNEDLSSFQNINDSGHNSSNSNIGNGNNGTSRHNDGIVDKRQQYNPPDRNVFRNMSGVSSHHHYSRTTSGGNSISNAFQNDVATMQHRSREGRPEMGKFVGGRPLTTRTNIVNNNVMACNNGNRSGNNINDSNDNSNDNNNSSSSNGSGNFNNKIGSHAPVYEMAIQREGSFGSKTKGGYPGGSSSMGRHATMGVNCNGNYNHSNGNSRHRYTHHDYPGGPTIPYDQVAPLEKSANRWVPATITTAIAAATKGLGRGAAEATEEQGLLSQEEITRKVKALLNKLTLERFDSISDKIIAYAEQSTKEEDGRSLQTVIQLIFEKACDEAAFASMWAQLCRKLYEWIPSDIKDVNIKDKNNDPICGIPLYCKYLLNRCQHEFEKGWKSLPHPPTSTAATTAANDSTAATTAATEIPETTKDFNNEGDDPTANKKNSSPAHGEVMMSEEYYTAVKMKRQGLGLVQFIGELYRREMLTQRIMYQCLKRLCDNGSQAQEEEVESLCKLLTTIGADIDRGPQTATWIDVFFKRMKNEMYHSPNLSSRVKFMILDVFDLRKSNWVPRKSKEVGPKTIAEIHEEAEKQKLLEKEMFNKKSALSRGLSSTIPYGTSRQGSYRNAGKPMKRGGSSSSPGSAAPSSSNDTWNSFANSGNNGLSSSPSRHETNDYSNFGRAERSRSRNNVLGPSYSPFASINRSAAGGTAKSMERKSSSNSIDNRSSHSPSSTSNMFGALGNHQHHQRHQYHQSHQHHQHHQHYQLDQLHQQHQQHPTQQEENQEEIKTERKSLALLSRGSVLPTNDNAEVESKQQVMSEGTISKGLSLDETQLKRRIKNLLAEYYELQDVKEFVISVKELDQPEIQSILATQLLEVVELKEKQVDAVCELFPQLYGAQLLQRETMITAFQQFMKGYDDLTIDVPQAPSYVARLLVKAHIDLSDICHSELLPSSLLQSYNAISR